ncbi:MAG TPA: hypothetical protein EYP10_11705, partial [Armatimonadetes bacterium]|nr:hypothetical protein [Armatimonadota bacterium]
MQNYIVALAVSAMLLTVVSAFGDALFEVTHVVKMPKRTYGYRGMNGDLLQLKDGSILYCYTRNGIVARKSMDRGKTWS